MARSVSLRAIVALPRRDSTLLHSGPGSRTMSSGPSPASAARIEIPAEVILRLRKAATSGMPPSLSAGVEKTSLFEMN
jgi:hypothetical protein